MPDIHPVRYVIGLGLCLVVFLGLTFLQGIFGRMTSGNVLISGTVNYLIINILIINEH